MKCLVINLDRSVDRLAHMTSEFAKIGVAFERVPAVDAAAEFPNLTASDLTKPEIGCFLSHRKCWQIIADGEDRYGAVFEDDAVFSGAAGLFLSDDNWVPTDADIVKLETHFTKVRISARAVSVGNQHSVARLVGDHAGSAGYLISKRAAQRLLHRTGDRIAVLDGVLFSPTAPTVMFSTNYQLMPAICAQAQFFPERAAFPTLIGINLPHRTKGIIAKIRSETLKAFAHCWNGTIWGTRRVKFVEFGD